MKKKLLLLFIAIITISLLVFSACNAPSNDDGDGGDQTENGGGENTGGSQSGGTIFDCAAGKHNYTVENKCSVCSKAWKYSEGLEFELSDDENYYSVEGIGTCTDTELVIPYGYDGKPVKYIDYKAFEECTGLTSVTIPDSVTYIGDKAFYNCTGLTSVTIGNSVTNIGSSAFYNTGYYNNGENWENGVLYIDKYLIRVISISGSYTIKDGTLCIGDDAFDKCTGLTSVTIPNSVTSIGDNAFDKCTGLTSVTIPDSVTSIGYEAFYGCTGLIKIIIPESVKSLGYQVFRYCPSLEDVTLPYVPNQGHIAYFFDPGSNLNFPYDLGDSLKSVTILGGGKIPSTCFRDGGGSFPDIESITIGSGVTSISAGAFDKCTKLKNITIADSVTSIGADVFYGKRSLDSVNYLGDIASWCAIEFESLDSNPMWWAKKFYLNGRRLSGDLVIPDEVTKIPYFTFKNSDITSITIPGSVTSISLSGLDTCTKLTSVTIGYGVTELDSFSDCTELTSITIPDSVTYIPSNAFYNTGYYNNEANWENGVLYVGNHLIEAKNSISGDYAIKDGTLCIANRAFYNCTGLTSITIPNSVTSIGNGAFSGCSGLTSITIPNSVTSIDVNAFYNTGYYNNEANWENGVLYIGKYLIKAKSSISGNYTIKDGTLCISSEAFYQCDEITNITIPDSITSIDDYTFAQCSGLTNITIPDSVTSIGVRAFSECGLTSVTIGNSVTSIGNGAFYRCYSLESVTIGNSVTNIGSSAFWDCNRLTSVTIPDSVTSIGYDAFYSCDRLTSVTIPDSVTSIGSYAFKNCTLLTSIKYYGTKEQWYAISKNSYWNYNTGNYTITYNYTGE